MSSSRPKNSPLARPPAKSTRASTSDVYVVPEFQTIVARKAASDQDSAQNKCVHLCISVKAESGKE